MFSSEKLARSAILLVPFISFITLPFIASTYAASKLILLSAALIIAGSAIGWTAFREKNFSERLHRVLSHPFIIVYGLFVAWLFLRSLATPSVEILWGIFDRNEGVFFHLAFLHLIITGSLLLQEASTVLFWKWFARGIAVITGGSLLIHLTSGATDRFFGTVGNPLYLSGALLIIPFAVRYVRAMYERVAILCVTGAAIYFADTRGAFLALAVFALTIFFTSIRIPLRVRAAVVSISLLALIGGAIGVLKGSISLERISTINTRVAMWRSGFSELKQQPLLGYGLHDYITAIDRGAADLQSVSYNEITNTTHNGFLDIALQSGVIGLALFIVMLVVGGITLKRLGGENGRYAVAFYLAWITLAATSFFSIWFSLPLIILFGMGVQKSSVSKITWPHTRFAFIAFNKILMIGALLLLVGTLYGAVYANRVNIAFAKRQYAQLPMYTAPPVFMPYSEDWFLSVLRKTTPLDNLAVIPSYERFVQAYVAPHVIDLESDATMYPSHSYVFATWSSFYADVGLAKNWSEWKTRAISFQESALSKNPNRPSTIFALANMYQEVGRIDDALTILKKVVDENPKLPEAHLFYAAMIDISGDHEGAMREAGIALELKPLNEWRKEQQEFLLGDHDHAH